MSECSKTNRVGEFDSLLESAFDTAAYFFHSHSSVKTKSIYNLLPIK